MDCTNFSLESWVHDCIMIDFDYYFEDKISHEKDVLNRTKMTPVQRWFKHMNKPENFMNKQSLTGIPP